MIHEKVQLYFLIYMLYSHLRNRYRLKHGLFLTFLLIQLLFFNVFLILNLHWIKDFYTKS